MSYLAVQFHLDKFNTSTLSCLYTRMTHYHGLLSGSVINLLAMQKTQKAEVPFLGWDDPLEKGMATHSRIFAWRIPGTEEADGVRSKGSQRVGHSGSDLARTHTNTHIHVTSSVPICR